MYNFFGKEIDYALAVDNVIGACGSRPQDEDRLALFECAKFGKGEGFIVEIGSMFGSSLAMLAGGSKLVNREKVISIDIMEDDPKLLFSRNYYESFGARCNRLHRNLLCLDVADWVLFCGFGSKKAKELLKEIPIRLLHIDGAHNYENCSFDIGAWGSQLVSGGSIFVHDYAESSVGVPEIYNAVTDLIQNNDQYTDFKFIEPLTAHAIKV